MVERHYLDNQQWPEAIKPQLKPVETKVETLIASSIQASVMGAAQPLTDDCHNMSHEQAKLCLTIDRRVKLGVISILR